MILVPTKPAVISSGSSLSSAVEVGGATLCAIVMPASWTSASLTLQASVDGTNYSNVYDEFGTEVTFVANAGTCIRLNPSDWFFAPFIKVRSGTSGSAVNQAADRTLTLVLR